MNANREAVSALARVAEASPDALELALTEFGILWDDGTEDGGYTREEAITALRVNHEARAIISREWTPSSWGTVLAK